MTGPNSKEQGDGERISFSLSLLNRQYPESTFRALGIGAESVVLTDGRSTYKVFDRTDFNYSPLMQDLHTRFQDAKRFVQITGVSTIEGLTVIEYPYEESIPYTGGLKDELVEFLVECKRLGVACWDVKPRNFRYFKDGLKFIDIGWDIKPYNFKDYLIMAQRAYLTLKYPLAQDFLTLTRRAITDWEIPELEGFNRFFDGVYKKTLTIGVECQHPITYDQTLAFKSVIQKIITSNGLEAGRILEHLGMDAQPICNAAVSVHRLEEASWQRFDVVVSNSAISGSEKIFGEYLQSVNGILRHGGLFILVLEHPYFCGDPSHCLSGIKLGAVRSGFTLQNISESPYYTDVNGNFKSDSLALAFMRTPSDTKEVSLVIKACYQDGATLERQVRHIVGQCEQPRAFAQRIVVVDPKRDGFLRQYAEPTAEATYAALERLKVEGIIDEYLMAPQDELRVRALNKRWFNIDTAETHSVRNIPVAPQLFAFEATDGEYVLQADSDVIVGRRDLSHDYLEDMVAALRENPHALSVSFNIAHPPGTVKKEYSSPGNGDYVPEVRFCMFDKKRFLSARPLPNDAMDGKLAHSWYRSMHQHQRQHGLASLRGGDPRTFYIHPQNTDKKDVNAWFQKLDRVEHGYIPSVQHDSVDLTGSYRDWCVPKRREAHVFIICGRNVSPEKFYRCWQSVTNQNRTDWGAVIVDDASTNCLTEYMEIATAPYKDKVTLIKNHRRNGILKNIHGAITNFCTNPFSVIIILDADDMLVGNYALGMVHRHYIQGADATVGTPIRMDKGYYFYEPDFSHPRNPRGGDVWMHLRTFYKYLFDAVPTENFIKDGKWIDKFSELTYMVPIIEMANHPVHMSIPIYLWEPTHTRNDAHYRKNNETIAHVLSINQCVKFDHWDSGVIPPGLLLDKIRPDKVTFIRHAERMTEGNTQGNYTADDIPITEDGISDCLAWGAKLPVKLDLIISSPAKRTVQTAENIRAANKSSCRIITQDCLRGVRVNDQKEWNRLKEDKGRNRVISEWLSGKLDSAIIDPFNVVMNRIVTSINSEIIRNESKNVLVVSHDHMLNVLYQYLMGRPAGRAGYIYGFSIDPHALEAQCDRPIKPRSG